jgi:hypothetical protein
LGCNLSLSVLFLQLFALQLFPQQLLGLGFFSPALSLLLLPSMDFIIFQLLFFLL